MIGLPTNTEVNHFISKNKIYTKFELNNAQKTRFDEDIKKITVVNEVSAQTVKLADGEKTHSFFVLEVQLKHKTYDEKNIVMLSKLIEQNLLLVLAVEEQERLAVFHTILHQTEWKKAGSFSLTLNGLNYDSMWDNVIRTVGGIEASETESLDVQIAQTVEKEKLNKQIAALEVKIKNEKQPNKKFELCQQLYKIKEGAN